VLAVVVVVASCVVGLIVLQWIWLMPIGIDSLPL